ncbi:Uncharacterised protein [Providencia stuartii]|nr:Uncharacterised protein [Providencia stuartii]
MDFACKLRISLVIQTAMGNLTNALLVASVGSMVLKDIVGLVSN